MPRNPSSLDLAIAALPDVQSQAAAREAAALCAEGIAARQRDIAEKIDELLIATFGEADPYLDVTLEMAGRARKALEFLAALDDNFSFEHAKKLARRIRDRAEYLLEIAEDLDDDADEEDCSADAAWLQKMMHKAAREKPGMS